MNVREMSDVELVRTLLQWVNEDPARRNAAYVELYRRLALVPRCPTCGREVEVHRGNCGECATSGVEVGR